MVKETHSKRNDTGKHYTFQLVLEKIKRRKVQSLSIMLILMISVSFAIMSLSLIDSLQKTNQEYRKTTFGEWLYRVTDISGRFDMKLPKMDGIDYYGTMTVVGTVYGSITEEGIGTVDENMIKAGRWTLEAGKWPEQDDEVVLSENSLASLGYGYDLGQELMLSIEVPVEGAESIHVEKAFTLSGILPEYAKVWASESGVPYASIMVTEGMAASILEGAGQGAGKNDVSSQYYLVLDESVVQAQEKLAAFDKGLKAAFEEIEIDTGEKLVCEKNDPILASASEAVENGLYVRLLAMVSLIAVLCSYLMRMTEEIHYAAVLRAMGTTTGQLAGMGIVESLYLVLPAALLGIPVGAGLTWLGLKYVMTTGIAQLHVAIPYGKIIIVIGLWFVIALMARMIITVVTFGVPLTGKINISLHKQKAFRYLRNAAAIAVLGVCVSMLLSTTIERTIATAKKEEYEVNPHYQITSDVLNGETGQGSAVSEAVVKAVRDIPDIAKTVSYSFADIGLSGGGIADRTVQLIIVDAAEYELWHKLLRLSPDEKATFCSGESVVMCFPEADIDASHMFQDEAYLIPGETLEQRQYTVPDGTVTLSLYNVDHSDVAEKTLPAAVRYLSYEADRLFNGVELHSAYTIICSSEMIKGLLEDNGTAKVWTPPYQEKLLAEDGTEWKRITYGGTAGVGCRYVDVWADTYGNFTYLDRELSALCAENNLTLENNRKQNMSLVQEQLQKLVRISVVSICVGLLAWLIYMGVISLEKQDQLRYYRLLRSIGMSKKQIGLRVMIQGALRLVAAIACGLGYFIFHQMQMIILTAEQSVGVDDDPVHLTLSEAGQWLANNWDYYGIRVDYILLVMSVFFIVAMIVTVWIKKNLWRGEIQ